MKLIWKAALILSFLTVVFVVTACGSPDTDKAFDAQLASQLQAVLDDAVEKSENMVNGTLLHVSSSDLGTWTGASGVRNIETSDTTQPSDKVRAGSIMKPFVSVVVLQLVEEGLFSLDDPLTKVLPVSVTDKFSNSSRITVRMLLNHTAGIPEWLGDAQHTEIASNPTKIWKVEEYISLAASQEPYFEPGEGLIYTNTDYNLLGVVIEHATGHTWREEIQKRIIEELNLKNTRLPEPGEIVVPDDHIRGYIPMNGQLIDATGIDPSMAGAAGGHALETTTEDLILFMDAVIAGELFQNTETLEEMLTFKETDPYGMSTIPGVEWEYYGYGLGLERWVFPNGVELIGHSGTTAGFTAGVFHLPAQNITITWAWDIQELRVFFLRMVFPSLDILVPTFINENADTRLVLQGLLDQQVKEQDILGIAMAVRLADGTVMGKASGYTDPSGEKAWSVDTVSALGSVTKTFTAVVVMQLVEDGKLSLDDTIDTWFPEQPNGDRITVRMLLSHTSGIANYISIENVMEGKWDKEWAPMDLVAEANKSGTVGEPGSSEAHYSNTNYVLLGLIVEDITGNSWAQEVESRIIKPLDLKDTTFLSTEGVWGGIMVEGYAKTPDGYISSLELPWYPHSSTVWSAGEVVSTVSDLMTFASALFDGKLVSRETLAVMAQPMGTDVDSGRIWGLGGATVEEVGQLAFGMGGDIPGYHAFFMGVLDKKIIVAALINTVGDVITPSISALEYISGS